MSRNGFESFKIENKKQKKMYNGWSDETFGSLGVLLLPF